MRKKKTFILLFLIMLFTTFNCIPVAAENVNVSAPRFEITSANILPGESFDIDIKVSDNPGITALQLRVEFDEAVFELTGIEHKELFASYSTSGNTFRSPFKISWFSQQTLDETTNGTLATLHFISRDNAPNGNYVIKVSYDEDNVFDSKFENVFFNTQNGIVSICDCVYGDVNQDGKVNMKDIVLLQKHLNGYDDAFDSKASDVYFDNVINMKDVVLLQQFLNGYDVTLGAPLNPQQPKEPVISSFVYGESEMVKDLICYSFTPANYTDTVLLNFAIHGYEDKYNADGQVLVDTAYSLIHYYGAHTDKLGTSRLLIVPCANPDGLYDGNTNNGFGRCNAKGIDLNRDFDANYTSFSSARNYTPYAFSASESRALRDLVLNYQADVVIDFHGWLDETIGDYEIGSIFAEEMNLQHYVSYTESNGNGYFSNWAHQQGALGLLVEFKNSQTVPLDKLEKSVDRILSGDYPKPLLNTKYQLLHRIDSYTLSNARETTYRFIDVPFDTVSYIDGETDKVTILDIYDNGWIKTQYPTSKGSKIGYCSLSAFVSPDDAVDRPYQITINANTNVYRRSDMVDLFGVAYTTDEITVVAEKSNVLQIIYPLDSGGYKMGWISKDA